ncbi:MAG: hypothetical protein ACKOEE_05035 [Tagaea sp.]
MRYEIALVLRKKAYMAEAYRKAADALYKISLDMHRRRQAAAAAE